MSTAKQNWATGFYWIGVAMTLACFALVLAGNTELVWRFEHKGFPLSWMFAGAAVIAFLVAEFGSSAAASVSAAQDQTSRLTPEFEAEF
jgi:hypothetical protein